ncbi:GAF and ANTAR domain-containing protein [Cryobacterium aureum]|uniref:GAF and ANTAR domain-containing protein n=1 Tax=Cryobacterium aureum TaxID=995037 RepID=UPI00101ADDDC|nr:GAF and ANTAR domain-containing protein [Cryobacterium aureum]
MSGLGILVTNRLAFGAAVEQLSLAHESRTSICAPFLHVLPVNAAAVCTLANPFGRETVCASNSMAALFDELQLDLGEGPSWDALHTRRPMIINNFQATKGATWPALMKASLHTGVRAVYAFPLSLGSLDIGAVSLFSNRSGGLSPAQILDAEVLVHIAAVQVLRRSLTSQTLKTNLEDNEGYSRRVVHQATGMVLVQLNLSAADALLIMHGHAFAHGRTVREVATDVVARRLDFSSIPES